MVGVEAMILVLVVVELKVVIDVVCGQLQLGCMHPHLPHYG